MKKDAIKYLKTTALRTTDSKINSTINNVLKALESFL
jgi:hypothetical protein